MKNAGVICLLILGALLNSCSRHTYVKVPLVSPPPSQQTNLVVPGQNATPPIIQPRPIILKVMGNNTPPYPIGDIWAGIQRIHIITVDSPREWVRKALRSQLEVAGYQVVLEGEAESFPTASVFSGHILTVSGKPRGAGLVGEVTFEATYTLEGKERIQKRYTAKASREPDSGETPPEAFRAVLTKTLAKGVRDVMKDINRIHYGIQED